RIADGEAERADRPYPLAADAVGEMAERDLPGNGDQADEAERPGGELAAEADLDHVLGLVHLHRVPGEEPEGEAGRDPPEPRGGGGPRQGPLGRDPRGIDDAQAGPRRGA